MKKLLLPLLALLACGVLSAADLVDDFTDGKLLVIDMLLKTKLAASKSEARRLIQQGGVLIADAKVDSLEASIDESAVEGDGLIIKKGKKTYHKITK